MMNIQIKPLERNTLVQQAVNQILDLIRDGSLAPGDRLPSERELMKLLNVGRSTVREALQSLAMVQMVEQRHGEGTFVKDQDVTSVIRADLMSDLLRRSMTGDLLEVRKIIEPATVELAAVRAYEEELEIIQKNIDDCRQAHAENRSTADLSAEFHRMIAKSTHNQVLVMFMDSILGLLKERGSKVEHILGYTVWEIESHQEILNAMKASDAGLGHRLMVMHLEDSARYQLDDLA